MPVEGSVIEGVVVCTHPYGLGVYVPRLAAFGHVDVPFMGRSELRSRDDEPPVGSVLPLTVSRSERGLQIKLRVTAITSG